MKKKTINLKNQKGITLVALVITIVVLLILSAVAITSITRGGIVEKARKAQTDYSAAETEETDKLTNYENIIEKYAQGNNGEDDKKTFTFTLNQLGTPDDSFADSILEFDINIASEVFGIDVTKYAFIITTDDEEFNQAISELAGGEFMMYAGAEPLSSGIKFSFVIQGGDDDIVVPSNPGPNQILYTTFLSTYGNVELTATAFSMESEE